MSRIPYFNFPAFKAAAYTLRRQGHFVFNPAEEDIKRHGGIDISLNNPTGDPDLAAGRDGFSLADALTEDLNFIMYEATTVAFLPGWEYSAGANLEWDTAKIFKREFMYL